MDKNKAKVIFEQTMIISTGIFFMIGIGGVITHLSGGEFSLDWYHPLSIILIGFLCALPTVFLKEIDGNKSGFGRIVLHFLCLLGVVSFAGRIFRWYTELSGYMSLVVTFIIVYVFVWLSSLWMGKVDENKINKALEDFHDEE